jgi:glucose 1-dehydrogenase
MMEKRFDNKVAVVTGAASGIGRAIAIAFATEGAKVVVGDIRETPREGGTPTRDLINEKCGKETAIFVKVDVASKAEVDNLVEKAVEKFQRLDVMVNNAGILVLDPPHLEKTQEQWERIIHVNLCGVWYGCQAAIKQFLKQGSEGKIVNMSSDLAFTGAGPNYTSYCATKAGIANMTRQLAVEFGARGINVNAVAPGFVCTAMTEQDEGFVEGSQKLEDALKATPSKRLGLPEDVAACAIFLASKEADYVNGHNLVVDGGQLHVSFL